MCIRDSTNFEFQLPYSIAIKERSLALIDVVVVPNTILTVERGNNDRIWLREILAGGGFVNRSPQMQAGYYTLETLQAEIQAVLNFDGDHPKQIPGMYTVAYDRLRARFQFLNTSSPDGYGFVLYTEEDYPQIGAPPKPVSELAGAWRQMGLARGPHILANALSWTVSASGAPNLQAHTPLFIKTSLGIPATSVGPRGNMSIARRVIMDAPGPPSLVVDRRTASWDTISIPPSTISTSTMQLCGV